MVRLTLETDRLSQKSAFEVRIDLLVKEKTSLQTKVEELKDKLSAANADRAALIGRLRDSQIQMQLLREQIFELQTAVIDKLSFFQGQSPIKTKDRSQIVLHDEVEEWLPKVDRDN